MYPEKKLLAAANKVLKANIEAMNAGVISPDKPAEFTPATGILSQREDVAVVYVVLDCGIKGGPKVSVQKADLGKKVTQKAPAKTAAEADLGKKVQAKTAVE